MLFQNHIFHIVNFCYLMQDPSRFQPVFRSFVLSLLQLIKLKKTSKRLWEPETASVTLFFRDVYAHRLHYPKVLLADWKLYRNTANVDWSDFDGNDFGWREMTGRKLSMSCSLNK